MVIGIRPLSTIYTHYLNWLAFVSAIFMIKIMMAIQMLKSNLSYSNKIIYELICLNFITLIDGINRVIKRFL